MVRSIPLAAAPQIVQPGRAGVQRFVQMLMQNSALVTLGIVFGGALIAVCIALLVIRKFWPQCPLGQSLQQAGTSSIVWCVVGMLAGLIFILPAQILPFLAGIGLWLAQLIMDIASRILNI